VSVVVEVQYASCAPGLPAVAAVQTWVAAAAEGCVGEVVVRVVDAEEGARLNSDYRDRDGPTNVLSFAYTPPSAGACAGDLVLCAPVVLREADEQGKTPEAHWAHLVVHGVLHLRGYDHQSGEEAAAMEAVESEILARLGYPDPYATAPAE
jgi:probable rRNA maturation factor